MSHRVGPQSGDGVTTEPLVRLLGPGEIRALAGRLGVRPSKRLGQNFVVEQGTVRRIAVLAALRPDDVVLEVGPGLGSLTLALLEAGAGQLVAVEIDRALAGELPRTIAAHAPHLAGRTVVVTADALKIGEPGGDCDWPSVMAALDAIGYHGWATAEVPGGGLEELKDISQRMDRAFATPAFAARS